MRARIPVLLVCAGLVAGCASNAGSPGAGTPPTSPPTSPSTGATGQPTSPPGAGTVSTSVATGPETAAAAKSAATLFLDLYGAAQYAATYEMLSPGAKRAITERTWVTVHQQCKQAPGTSYTVTQPVLTGSSAEVNVSPAGSQSELSSDRENLIYRGGKWCFVPPDLALYRDHTATQVLAELKSMGECA
jgi:hypothetical protein